MLSDRSESETEHWSRRCTLNPSGLMELGQLGVTSRPLITQDLKQEPPLSTVMDKTPSLMSNILDIE